MRPAPDVERGMNCRRYLFIFVAIHGVRR